VSIPIVCARTAACAGHLAPRHDPSGPTERTHDIFNAAVTNIERKPSVLDPHHWHSDFKHGDPNLVHDPAGETTFTAAI
jgi:hypothetical protein